MQLRSWGIALVDGRMPGFAAIVGAAKSNEVAVKIVRELQRRNILIFLSGNVNGRSIIHQLQEEGVEMGYDTYIVPFGLDTLSAIYALGFATRSALTFGGLKAGQAREILLYNRARVFAFVLALGEIDDLKYAAAAGAINYGFPVIADTVIPQILPTGVTQHEHVVSLPFNSIHGKDDLERAEKLVQQCIETRGVKIKITEVPVPVPYGSAFEGEVVRKKDMRVEFGGKYSRAFEYLRMVPAEQVEDGRVEVIGPSFADVEEGGYLDLGILDRGGRPQDADRLRAGAGAPGALLRQRRQRHPAHRPARHRLDPHQQGRGRQGLHPGALRQDPARPLPRRVRRHRGQGAGQGDHRPGPARRVAAACPRRLQRAQRAHGLPGGRERAGVLHLHPVPELCADPRLHRQPGAAGPVRRLQLAGLQGQLRDQPHRPQPADPPGRHHRPGQGLLDRHQRRGGQEQPGHGA